MPAKEFSWSSKTLSRFAQLRLAAAKHLGDGMHSVEGSPADCANIGIHQLEQTMPGLVVSGVNIGENAGLAFLLSSGTVGAAVEASLAGVPAAAFSVRLTSQAYNSWRDTRDPAPLAEIWDRAAAIAAEIVAELLRGGLPQGARLLTVNIPQDADLSTPRLLTRVADTTYGSFFRTTDDGTLVHHFAGQRLVSETSAEEESITDIEALEAGAVSITPLRFNLDAVPAAADRVRFECNT